jgi:thiamine kinase-like enzyme
MPVIDDIIAKIDEWKGCDISIQQVTGGLTNLNYKVIVDGTPYFVRVPGADTELLSVDRRNELFNSRAAAQAGVGPRVLYDFPEFQAMVLEFLDGTTMSRTALSNPGMPAKIAQAIRQLHSGPRFMVDFDMFRLTRYYLDLCKQKEIPIPAGFVDRMPAVARIEQALAVHPLPSVPCNNDLLAENYIYAGDRLRIIDYEYSGNNDPCFELGNTCQELLYDEACIAEVCTVYFGAPAADKISRMKLYMVMSDIGWSLWAAIQAKISRIEYNFWGWAVERWDRAVQKMDSPGFNTWLENVQT